MVSIIMSKREWEALNEDRLGSIKIYRETELHHQFGDHPEEEIVRVDIQLNTEG